MRLPDARSFCCCFSVEKGVKIIAWIQLIFGVGLCILCSKYMFKDVLSYKYYHKTDILLGMILFAFSLYPVVQGTLLLIGINKKKPRCLMAWMVLAFIVEFGVTSCLAFYVASILTFSRAWYWMTVAIYCNAIQIGIAFYLIVIVSTCRKEIISKNSSSDGLYTIHTV